MYYPVGVDFILESEGQPVVTTLSALDQRGPISIDAGLVVTHHCISNKELSIELFIELLNHPSGSIYMMIICLNIKSSQCKTIDVI